MVRTKFITWADMMRQEPRRHGDRPSPAKTGKGTNNTMKDKKKKTDVSIAPGDMNKLAEILGQIQCKLGSLDRAVQFQAEKVVEFESRMERKRGAEISKLMVFVLFLVVHCLFSAQDDAGTRKKAKREAGTTSNAQFR